GHLAGVNCLAFAPDGALSATGGDDMTLALWDVGTGQLRSCIAAHSGMVEAVAFAPDGRTVATACEDWKVRRWASAPGPLRVTPAGPEGRPSRSPSPRTGSCWPRPVRTAPSACGTWKRARRARSSRSPPSTGRLPSGWRPGPGRGNDETSLLPTGPHPRPGPGRR